MGAPSGRCWAWRPTRWAAAGCCPVLPGWGCCVVAGAVPGRELDLSADEVGGCFWLVLLFGGISGLWQVLLVLPAGFPKPPTLRCVAGGLPACCHTSAIKGNPLLLLPPRRRSTCPTWWWAARWPPKSTAPPAWSASPTARESDPASAASWAALGAAAGACCCTCPACCAAASPARVGPAPRRVRLLPKAPPPSCPPAPVDLTRRPLPACPPAAAARSGPSEALNAWSGSISKLLLLVEKTCQQIQKESMVHRVPIGTA